MTSARRFRANRVNRRSLRNQRCSFEGKKEGKKVISHETEPSLVLEGAHCLFVTCASRGDTDDVFMKAR